MIEGKHEYFTIQHRRTHESPWLDPKGPLKPVEDEWHLSSFDAFGKAFDPWGNRKNNHGGTECVKQFPEASDEIHNVWVHTGSRGWWTLNHAISALKRAKEANDRGVFDSRSAYGGHQQALRYEFRIVKISFSYYVEEATMDHVVQELKDY